MHTEQGAGEQMEVTRPIIDDYGNVVGRATVTYQKIPAGEVDRTPFGLVRRIETQKGLS